MSFGDWDHLQNTATSASLSIGLELTNAIVGSGSLRVGFDGPGATVFNQSHSSHLNNTFTRGLTKGRIRTLWQLNHATAQNRSGALIYFMCDNLNPTNTATNAYVAGLQYSAVDTYLPVIAKMTGQFLDGGLSWQPGGSLVVINSASTLSLPITTTVPFQIEWNLDLAAFGGVRMTMSVGLPGDTNFSNLSVIYDVIDSSTPHTTSVIEGIGELWPQSSPGISLGEFSLWDSTGVFQLV